jgi:capsid portal protein
VLVAFQDKPSILSHSTFRKFVQMLHSQSYFVETETCRLMMQSSLNNFINIAKNQNYEKSDMDLSQLV